MTPRRPTSAATNLRSEGAEFLVLGNLLIRGIIATKAYTRFPGWDILATNPTTGSTCRIQVKARLATDFDGGFPIKNFDAEFVVLVALNRGNRYRKAGIESPDSIRSPDFWVLPMANVVLASTTASKWGESFKIHLRQIDGAESLQDAWHLVTNYLGIPTE